eukprot:TRINITY_DN35321_c0_g1_i1.p5 TRINITY_DN35321_c0_g1~~TRINITY_DN35321_c0_g1_i1.p5  ORF type:complete len:122 (+),score=54.68 TRINITY_DN35321_c0_g1_i1:614-979(+)
MYRGYVALLKRYGDLEILAFPCNQFGKQEPGTIDEIVAFARGKYGFHGRIMAKIDVNGAGAHPLWKYLKHVAPDADGTEDIKWNFAKFLIDQQGRVVKRFSPQDKISTIEASIKPLVHKQD